MHPIAQTQATGQNPENMALYAQYMQAVSMQRNMIQVIEREWKNAEDIHRIALVQLNEQLALEDKRSIQLKAHYDEMINLFNIQKAQAEETIVALREQEKTEQKIFNKRTRLKQIMEEFGSKSVEDNQVLAANTIKDLIECNEDILLILKTSIDRVNARCTQQ